MTASSAPDRRLNDAGRDLNAVSRVSGRVATWRDSVYRIAGAGSSCARRARGTRRTRESSRDSRTGVVWACGSIPISRGSARVREGIPDGRKGTRRWTSVYAAGREARRLSAQVGSTRAGGRAPGVGAALAPVPLPAPASPRGGSDHARPARRHQNAELLKNLLLYLRLVRAFATVLGSRRMQVAAKEVSDAPLHS